MKGLIIVNDPPYDTERVYNALRLAQSLLKKQSMKVSICESARNFGPPLMRR